jgi:serine/threonine protein kinase
LYSDKEKVWKIADFGLTAEASSNRAHTTHYGRGTSGYRAPELLREDRPSFNKRVDIWGFGCIVFELGTRKKAFNGDADTREYFTKREHPSKLMTRYHPYLRNESWRKLYELIVISALQVDYWERPSAAALLQLLNIPQRSHFPIVVNMIEEWFPQRFLDWTPFRPLFRQPRRSAPEVIPGGDIYMPDADTPDDDSESEGIAGCVCGCEYPSWFVDTEFMICCEGCNVWQHGACVGLFSAESIIRQRTIVGSVGRIYMKMGCGINRPSSVVRGLIV